MSELIVVGVDGSAGAAAALDYAATEAAERGARVPVVAVSQLHEYWAAWSGRARRGFPPPEVDFEIVRPAPLPEQATATSGAAASSAE